MAVSPPTKFSEAFLGQAAAEREQLLQHVREAELAVKDLAGRLSAAEKALAIQRAALLEVEEILGLSPQLALQGDGIRLGGRALRDKALEILEAQRIDGPIHYTEWFNLLVAEGYSVRGQNPLATFLSQISRDERIEPLGAKSGKYQLAAPRGMQAVAG